MKKSTLFVILVLTSSLMSCQNNPKKSIVTDKTIANPECELFYNKYVEKVSIMERDSALYFIDKSIQCNPTESIYKFSKAQLLVQVKQYKGAIEALYKIQADSVDNSINLFIAVLKMKINENGYKDELKNIYKNFSTTSDLSSSNYIYRITLDNYFNGKETAMKQIAEYKKKFTSAYEIQNVDAVERMIKSKSKEAVLYFMFNIK